MSTIDVSRMSFSPRPMEQGEAMMKTKQIRRRVNEARQLIYDVYSREGWKALEYKTFREYLEIEFDERKTMLYDELRAAKIELAIAAFSKSAKVRTDDDDSANGGNLTEVIGKIPERTLRPLGAHVKEPALVAEAWDKAVEETSGKPTGEAVARAVEEVAGEFIEARRRGRPSEPKTVDGYRDSISRHQARIEEYQGKIDAELKKIDELVERAIKNLGADAREKLLRTSLMDLGDIRSEVEVD